MNKITKIIKTIWAMILNGIVSIMIGIIFSLFIIPTIDLFFDLKIKYSEEAIIIIIVITAVQIFFFGERRNVFRSKDTKE